MLLLDKLSYFFGIFNVDNHSFAIEFYFSGSLFFKFGHLFGDFRRRGMPTANKNEIQLHMYMFSKYPLNC